MTGGRRAILGAALAAAVLVASGCAGRDGGGVETALAVDDPGAVHVHGLGYDAARDVLYVATHTGVFELVSGSERAERIGDSRQDTMVHAGHADAVPRLGPSGPA